MRYGRDLLPYRAPRAPTLLPHRIRAPPNVGPLVAAPRRTRSLASARCRTGFAAVALAAVASRAETHLDTTARATKGAQALRHRDDSAAGGLQRARGRAMLRTAKDFGPSRLSKPRVHLPVISWASVLSRRRALPTRRPMAISSRLQPAPRPRENQIPLAALDWNQTQIRGYAIGFTRLCAIANRRGSALRLLSLVDVWLTAVGYAAARSRGCADYSL